MMNSTQQRILDAASLLMTQKGVRETSLADIAREAGISRGTLFYHYSSKNDLVYDVAQRHLQQVTDRIMSWMECADGSVDPVELLEQAMDIIIRSETRGKLHMYLINDAVAGDDALRRRFQQTYRQWRHMIADALSRVCSPDEPQGHATMSHIVLAILDGLTIQSLIGLDDMPLAEIAARLA